jgi:peroxiredoxin
MSGATRTRSGFTVSLLTVAALTAGCGSTPTPQAQPVPTATTGMASAPSSPTAAASTTPAETSATPAETLKFSATTIDGKPFDATTLAGKPVVLWFWAAWCPKCRAKAGEVAAVQRELSGKVHVIGVAGLRSGDAAMDRFAADAGITGFPNLADDNGVVWKKFGVTTQEHFVIIDKAGTIVHNGPLSASDLRQRATALAG